MTVVHALWSFLSYLLFPFEYLATPVYVEKAEVRAKGGGKPTVLANGLAAIESITPYNIIVETRRGKLQVGVSSALHRQLQVAIDDVWVKYQVGRRSGVLKGKIAR